MTGTRTVLLRMKGTGRRVLASCRSLSAISRAGVIGLVCLVLVIFVVVGIAQAKTTSLAFVSSDGTPSALSDPAASSAEPVSPTGAQSTSDTGAAQTEQTGRAMSSGEASSVGPSEEASEAQAVLCVHVSGEVLAPGVYVVPGGSRIVDCVERAGGLTPEADQNRVNLAQPVSDGEHIIIYAQGQEQNDTVTGTPDDGLVHLNSADVAALCTLDGVGEVLAKRIITYRDSIGGFQSVTQLKNVSGIGEKRYNAIKDAVTL